MTVAEMGTRGLVGRAVGRVGQKEIHSRWPRARVSAKRQCSCGVSRANLRNQGSPHGRVVGCVAVYLLLEAVYRIPVNGAFLSRGERRSWYSIAVADRDFATSKQGHRRM